MRWWESVWPIIGSLRKIHAAHEVLKARVVAEFVVEGS
jgi:hypothetical protein